MPRDSRQARFLTAASLRWVVRNRAWTPYWLRHYWRFWLFRLKNRHVVTEGFVFLGRDVEFEVDRHRAQLVLGRWVRIGDGNRLRAHNGVLRLGDKVVLGCNNVINTHLDIEIGAATLVSDWVYICDFDHEIRDLERPIKDQGLVTTPVRIGPNGWVGTKVSVLRGTTVGAGAVLGAHAVVKGDFPDGAVVLGVPGRTVRRRGDLADDPDEIERRRYLEQIAAEQRDAVGSKNPPSDPDLS